MDGGLVPHSTTTAAALPTTCVCEVHAQGQLLGQLLHAASVVAVVVLMVVVLLLVVVVLMVVAVRLYAAGLLAACDDVDLQCRQQPAHQASGY
jgi:hypothetical protein